MRDHVNVSQDSRSSSVKSIKALASAPIWPRPKWHTSYALRVTYKTIECPIFFFFYVSENAADMRPNAYFCRAYELLSRLLPAGQSGFTSRKCRLWWRSRGLKVPFGTGPLCSHSTDTYSPHSELGSGLRHFFGTELILLYVRFLRKGCLIRCGGLWMCTLRCF